jgi:hypothetical protein
MLGASPQTELGETTADVEFRTPVHRWLVSYVGAGAIVLVLGFFGAITSFVLTSCAHPTTDPGLVDALVALVGGVGSALLCWRLTARYLRRWWVFKVDGVLGGGGGFRRWIRYEDVRLIREEADAVLLDLHRGWTERLRLSANDLIAATQALRSLSAQAATIDRHGQAWLAHASNARLASSRELAKAFRRRSALTMLGLGVLVVSAYAMSARFAATSASWYCWVTWIVASVAFVLLVFYLMTMRALADYHARVADGVEPPEDRAERVELFTLRLWPPGLTLTYVTREALEEMRRSAQVKGPP